MLNDSLNLKLAEAARKFNASSCTFYIRDPHWTDEYRLVAMTGVKRDESMYGFTSPESARKLLLEGPAEVYSISSWQSDDGFGNMPGGNMPERVRHLYVGFSEREGVQSCARFIHEDSGGEREAILFVNFSYVVEFDEPFKEQLRSFFHELVELLPAIRQELIKQDAEWLGQATKIASPVWSATNIDYNLIKKPDPYFNEVIGGVFRALDIKPESGLGTIYLYDVAENTLELHGKCGEIKDLEAAQTRRPDKWQGIVSWVALRRQALLIRDLAKSDYRDLHIIINDEVKSELAVPLEVRGELIGVMCLECTEVNKFLPHHVRSVWYAANQVAVAYLLHRHISFNRELLELSWQATVGESQARTSLNEVARLVKVYLQASYCDIWCYNTEAKRFELWGASYSDFYPQHRPNGWTDFVLRTRTPIWLSDIRSESQYSISHWQNGAWQRGAPDDTHPAELNSTPITQGVRSELGIPIVIRGECVGIAWVKYKRDDLECPKRDLMSSALGFAAEAGLVLDSILRREVNMKEKRSINHVGDDISESIKWRWSSTKPEIIDAYVISEPFRSALGGDFFAKKIIDKDTVGILLVDAQGHGVEGSLHMLPLMSAFESFWSSYSAAHVISSLSKSAKEVAVKGTAIYCIISVIEQKRWLCVTSAGHANLVVYTKKKGKWEFKYFPPDNGLMLGAPLDAPIMDYREEIPAGTIIVGYTDGVAESGLAFDANRLANFTLQFILDDEDGDPSKLAAAIMQKSRDQQPEGFQDDATVFVIHVK
jgi:sigma-B regulation protein RsbU (phosphoserine phosphatase)